jgi:hypothetical protein|uniref:Uncharacterized protein n=1 Tax=viral metagenome TaxID=1070528 RepID=A0A6C0IJG1_9ZZZZ
MSSPQYVITLSVLTHGRTTIMNLDPNTTSIFDNTRLYQLSRQLDYTPARCVTDTRTMSYLNTIFRKDFQNKTTFQVIQEYIDYSTPKYLSIYKENGVYVDDNIGNLYDPITFDKTIHTLDSISSANSFFDRAIDRNIFQPMFGIFIVSVHKKTINNGKPALKLVFPTPDVEKNDQNINLLDLNSVEKLTEYMPSLTTTIYETIHSIYEDEQPSIPSSIPRHDMPVYFNKSHANMRFMEGTNIKIVRLSYIVEMIKKIFGKNTSLNIMDYSCSVLPEDFPDKDKIYQQYMKPMHNAKMTDLELGSRRSFGGKRSRQLRSIMKNSKTKTTRRKKKSRKVKFSKKLRRYTKKTTKRRKKHTKRGGSTGEKTPDREHNFRPIRPSFSPEQSPEQSIGEISDFSYDNETVSSQRSSMSSLGDFEVEDLEKLRNIIDMIHTHIFFNYVDSGYNTNVLNLMINDLEVYDLHRKVEYIHNEVDKMQADSDDGKNRKHDVLETLDILLELMPNTREPTPIEEHSGGKRKHSKTRK